MGEPKAKLSAADFLAWERTQADRHFFFAGEVFAMAGGTAEHNAAALAIASSLRAHLKGQRCRTFIGDMRVQISAVEAYFYPDVVVTCAPQDVTDPKISTISAPMVVVEVLSPSTASFDRGQKFAAYRTLSSLQEVMLIDPELKTAEVFRKNGEGIWELHPSDAPTDVVRFTSLGWSAPLASLFE